VLDINNEVTSKTFSLFAEKYFLLQILSDYKFELKDCCKQLYSELLTDTNYIKEKSLIDQTYWIKVRQFRITGSRCYSTFTYNHNIKTNSDWEKKSSHYFWPKSFTSKFTQHGVKFENRVRKLYAKISGQNITKCGLLTSEIEKWLGYSPDGIILDSKNYPFKLLEIKCPFKGAALDIIKLLDNLNYIIKFDDGTYQFKKKHAYYGQVQLGMVMLNVSK
jgi:hypothetical protein